MSQANLIHLPVSMLSISKLNMRHGHKVPDVSDIMPSVREKGTAKAQKMVLANRIAGEGCAPNPGWCPGWMQVPPTRQIDGAACPPADASDRIGGLFGADAEHETGAEPSSYEATAA